METRELKISSELMQNYKTLHPVAVEKQMQAVCDNEQKCFLSISDEGSLYVTSEQEQSNCGWTRKDISPEIGMNCKEQVVVDTFSLAKDRKHGKYILAAVLKGDAQQYLFISVSTSVSSPIWREVELSQEMKKLSFYDVCVSAYMDKIYIATYHKTQNDHIERYFLYSPDQAYETWSYFPLPTDFTKLTKTGLGRAGHSRTDGTYTLGESSKTNQLLFTPAFNYYDPEILPTSSRLVLPHKTDALSVFSAPEKEGMTDLFICGEGQLSYFRYDNQTDMAMPVLIARSPHLMDVKQLFSYTSKGRIYIWILNSSKKVHYLFADIERRSDPGAWSVIMLLKEGLDYIYPFEDQKKNGLFGYTSNGEGVLGYESEQTGLWTYTSVFRQQTDQKSVLINSFVTLITTPEPEQEIQLRATEYGMADINGSVYTFKENAISVKSNAASQIKITQLAETLVAMEFEAWMDTGEKVCFNPGAEASDRLLALNTGKKLRDAVIVNQKGEKERLLPTNIPKQTSEAVALAIDTLNQTKKHVSGLHRIGNNEIHTGAYLRFQRDSENLLQTVVFDQKQAIREFREENIQQLCLYSCEEVFGFLRNLSESTTDNGFFDVIIEFFEGAWHFIVKTVERIVSFVIDCGKKIISCVIEIFKMIRVAVEKVIAFLKYVFDMDDILLVRDVIKKILHLSQADLKGKITDLKGDLKEAFDEMSRAMLEWGGISEIGEVGKNTLKTIPADSQDAANLHDVKANYLLNLMTENQNGADNVLKLSSVQANILETELDRLINSLQHLCSAEKEVMDQLIKHIQAEFFEDKSTADMDLLTVIQKLGAILANAIIGGLEAITEALFDILVFLLDALYDILNQEIYIPCVTEFLELCGIGRFSVLDLMCFVPAFLGSIAYKIVTQRPLITQEMHAKIMKMEKLSDLSDMQNEKNQLDALTFNREAFLSMKYISGIASFVEVIVAGINTCNATPSTVLSLATMACAVIDGSFYIANSFFVFNPLASNFSKPWIIVKYVLAVIKYSAFVVKGIWAYYYLIRKDLAGAERFDKIFGITYAATSIVAIGGNVAFLVKACNLEKADKREKEVFILDTISLIPDNLRNVTDGLLKYIRPQTPVPFGIILASRSIFGVAYGVLQIIEGHKGFNIK